MRAAICRIAVIAAVALSVVSAGALAAEADAPPPLLGHYITDTRALYPLRVGDWEAAGEKRYEPQELGVSVRYQDTRRPDRWMDLYLYPAGVMFDPVFEQVFRQGVDEIVQIARDRQAGEVHVGQTRVFATMPAAGAGLLGELAVKARSFALDMPMHDARYRSALAMTVRDLYFIKVRYSVQADRAADEDVQAEAEALLSGFVASVRVLNTGYCRQVLQVRAIPQGQARPGAVLASTNDGREDEMWITDDTVYLRGEVIERQAESARLRDEAQAIRDVLRGHCVAPDAMEMAVPDGMREIRFEYRLPPEGSDGSAPRLRGQRTGVG
ncbi:hypothetical protein [Pseudoxanthomonas mexicana]|uniref:hypothetical protein n=1 Tax=Pseudoxanthomonas mexicana TaxID=128785 RepID=UPI00209FC46D|nr:hypothetical protein [Pseudoxanthomonas mexicana]MCP1583192.1 hypothetical protein [Pseudoxanthomonas mexicana]